MNPIFEKIKKYWDAHPLACVMILAIMFRTFAVIFAKGFGMHDDHFCVIEIAQKWVNGSHEWLDNGVHGRSLVYPGLHYLLFVFLQKIGIMDPQMKMYVVRFFHAIFSLATVFFGYKTVRLIANEKSAALAGLLLAILWPMPFMSVRNLIEFVCIPPMIVGYYLLYRDASRKNAAYLFGAGVLFALAFIFRFQTLSIAGTIGIVLLIAKEYKAVLWYCIGFLVTACCLQGSTDWIWHGAPFRSFWYYVSTYSGTDNGAYPSGPVIMYLGLIIGVLIPPTSLLLLYGFGRTWKKYALIFWPTLVFFVIHSIIPNKQERFILPILPAIVMLSVIGWEEYMTGSAFWQLRKKMLSGLWKWFFIVNGLLLLLTTFTYSKKSRVETLSFLYNDPGVSGVLVESRDDFSLMMPLFYLGDKKMPLYYSNTTKPVDSLRSEISRGVTPNRVIFISAKNLDERKKKIESVTSELIYEKTVSPSIADQLLYFLNPKHNINQTSYIYRTKN